MPFKTASTQFFALNHRKQDVAFQNWYQVFCSLYGSKKNNHFLSQLFGGGLIPSCRPRSSCKLGDSMKDVFEVMSLWLQKTPYPTPGRVSFWGSKWLGGERVIGDYRWSLPRDFLAVLFWRCDLKSLISPIPHNFQSQSRDNSQKVQHTKTKKSLRILTTYWKYAATYGPIGMLIDLNPNKTSSCSATTTTSRF